MPMNGGMRGRAIKMTKEIDIVWPFKAPPVSHGNWDDEIWVNYIRQFRPPDYHGAEDDKEAWLDYLDQKNAESFRKQWPNNNIEIVGRDQFKMTRKE